MYMFLVASLVSRFFFFKQKTAYEMRISDWSSDVLFRSPVPASRDAGRSSRQLAAPPAQIIFSVVVGSRYVTIIACNADRPKPVAHDHKQRLIIPADRKIVAWLPLNQQATKSVG